MLRIFIVCLIITSLTGCDETAWNNPYPNQSPTANTLYSAISEQPKHLDPAKSYSENELIFLAQIYEPLLEYSYLLRPYKLQPLLATTMPKEIYDASTDTTSYHITIKPQIYYQQHPAFAQNEQHEYYYHSLTAQEAKEFDNLGDFKHQGTRTVTAADFIYEIKRLADPKVNSPVYGFLSDYIIGLQELHDQLEVEYKKNNSKNEIDLRGFDLTGLQQVDEFNYVIKIKGKYPQFKYWLAMPFFAPVPWEATVFYAQPEFHKRNISLDWYPIGTGAYILKDNNPERRLVLERNTNYHPDFYPSVGMPEDEAKGLLANAGKRLPLIDQLFFSLEKESIPYWDKFMQGYYDSSGISSDNFYNVISGGGSQIALTPELLAKNLRLVVTNNPSITYWGFNMLDDVVGGYSARAKKLRRAISLAFDVEEYILIFTNGRGIRAYGPIPPGILGYELEQPSSKLENAKQLLSEAGYPDGRDQNTGQQIQLYYDTMGGGDPNENANSAWMRKQFAKLGIDLIVRATDYNRFMEKARNGSTQIFVWGWGADYPDPENFLFLFYGPNGRVQYSGANDANYANPKFDLLFEEFKDLQDDARRLVLIKEMLDIINEDSPWIYGFYPQTFALQNPWVGIRKPSGIANNYLKYASLDPQLRAELRVAWNRPIIWPVALVVILVILVLGPAIWVYRRQQNSSVKRYE